MTLIEQIKAGREAGTAGPFLRTPGTGEIATHDGFYFARAIQADTPWGSANADRIARLDQLEAALLAADEEAKRKDAQIAAADELARAIDPVMDWAKVYSGPKLDRKKQAVDAALAAYRRAGGGA